MDILEKILNNSELAEKIRIKCDIELYPQLQKQDDMLQVKMQLVQYQSERLIAWSNLNAQLGGGFKSQ